MQSSTALGIYISLLKKGKKKKKKNGTKNFRLCNQTIIITNLGGIESQEVKSYRGWILKCKLFNRLAWVNGCSFIDITKYQILMRGEPGLFRLAEHLTCATISGNFNYRKNSETLSRSSSPSLPSLIKTKLYAQNLHRVNRTFVLEFL